MSLRNYFFIVLFSWNWGVYLIKSLAFRHDFDIDRVAELLTKKHQVLWINDYLFEKVTKHWRDVPAKVISNFCTIKTIRNRDFKIDRLLQKQLHSDEDLIIKLIENSVSTLRVSSGGRWIRSLDREA